MPSRTSTMAETETETEPRRRYGCSACSFMKRPCPTNCPLAPYFSPECESYFFRANVFIYPLTGMDYIRQQPSPAFRRLNANSIATRALKQNKLSDEVRDLLVETLLGHAEILDREEERLGSAEISRRIAAGAVPPIGQGHITGNLGLTPDMNQERMGDIGDNKIVQRISVLQYQRSLSPGGCSACRFMIRKCPQDCPLAPHFPQERGSGFDAVNLLLDPLSAIEAICMHQIPLFRQTNAKDIAKKVAELGGFPDVARDLLAQSLLDHASICETEERSRLRDSGHPVFFEDSAYNSATGDYEFRPLFADNSQEVGGISCSNNELNNFDLIRLEALAAAMIAETGDADELLDLLLIDPYEIDITSPNGIDTTLPNGTHTTLPNGIDTTLPNGIHTTLPNGIDTTLPNGIDTTLPNGIDTTLPNGIHTTLPNGIDTTLPNVIHITLPRIHTTLPNGIRSSSSSDEDRADPSKPGTQ